MERASKQLHRGVFFQQGYQPDPVFGDAYRTLRSKEGIVYQPDEIKKLPDVGAEDAHHPIWKVRRRSANMLLSYLSSKEIGTVLEVGAGNAWLSALIQRTLEIPVTALDSQPQELELAAQAFAGQTGLRLVCGDIHQTLGNERFDIIILAGTIQYFADPTALLRRLLDLLTADGEIHIADSPIYPAARAQAAARKTQRYFESIGCEMMLPFYHYHTDQFLRGFNWSKLHDPDSLWTRAKRFVDRSLSPFAWVKISK